MAITTFYCLCKIIGDGKSDPANPFMGGNAFRAAILDVLDDNGTPAFRDTRAVIAQNPDGTLVNDWTLVRAEGDVTLLAGNPDIQLLKVDKDTPVDQGKKTEVTAALDAFAIDTAVTDQATKGGDIIAELGKLHDPEFDVVEFDKPL